MFDLQPPRHISTLHIAQAADARVMFGFGEPWTWPAPAPRDGLGANDPSRTSAGISYCRSEAGFSLYPGEPLRGVFLRELC